MSSSVIENKVLRNTSLFLGVTIFTFGFLKLFDPFHSWFQTQIANSNLPPFSFELGIAGELGIGTLFVMPFVANDRLRAHKHKVLAFSSLALIVAMSVATYVHLHPAVPADVLPLKIKPPFIPLSFLFIALFNLYQIYKAESQHG
jgi:hypothetical protein